MLAYQRPFAGKAEQRVSQFHRFNLFPILIKIFPTFQQLLQTAAV